MAGPVLQVQRAKTIADFRRAMGFGLPAAIRAAVAQPDAVAVDIDIDGSFMMNVQEIRAENLPIKIMVINNQHLGMVQWEDRYYKGNRQTGPIRI